MPSLKPTPEQMHDLGEHIQGQGKIAQLIQLRALNWLNKSEHRAGQTDQVERDWYAKQLGANPKASEGSEDMETTILGDIHITQTPEKQPTAAPSKSSALPLVVGMLASGLIGGGAAGLATYLMTRKPAPVAPTFEDETVQIGLGRISDYIKDETQ
jgi:hypothetical protein